MSERAGTEPTRADDVAVACKDYLRALSSELKFDFVVKAAAGCGALATAARLNLTTAAATLAGAEFAAIEPTFELTAVPATARGSALSIVPMFDLAANAAVAGAAFASGPTDITTAAGLFICEPTPDWTAVRATPDLLPGFSGACAIAEPMLPSPMMPTARTQENLCICCCPYRLKIILRVTQKPAATGKPIVAI